VCHGQTADCLRKDTWATIFPDATRLNQGLRQNMTDADPSTQTDPGEPVPILRCVVGGALMGVANLVPGISGGTMLLAAGAYPRFISAVADLSTFKFRRRSLLTVGLVAGSAIVAIGALAAVVLLLIGNHRWVMFSLFIGLTLGGVPVVWSLLKPANSSAWFGFGAGLTAMIALALVQQTPSAGSSDATTAIVLLFLAGALGASAMILPGVSGAYLLLVLGVYLPILEGLKMAASAVRHMDMAALWGPALYILLPVGLGVVVGVAVVSNLLRWLLAHLPKPTFGVLLGLLVGAVAGLWPFRAPARPDPGDLYRGQFLTAEMIEKMGARKWPTESFDPTITQIVLAIGLIAIGFVATSLLAKLGKPKQAKSTSE
jgi:putative membrane protein